MTQEKLIDAITDLDSDILNRYFDMKAGFAAKKKPKKRTWGKWASMAACFCIIFVSVIFLIPRESEIDYNTAYLEGAVITTDYGTITFKNNDIENQVVTFIVEKENNSKIYCMFSGAKVINEWVDEDNEIHRQYEHYKAVSKYDFDDKNDQWTLLNDILKITVDGVETDTLPSQKGKYEISLDYGAFAEMCGNKFEQQVVIYGFGAFVLDINK